MSKLMGMGCVIAALAAGACSSSKSASVDAKKTADAAPAAFESVSCTGITPDATVTTGANVFTPMSTTISMGQVVEFMPAASHNVIGSGTANGIDVGTGGMTGCYRFVATGTFPFSCTIHGFMGSVTVQ